MSKKRGYAREFTPRVRTKESRRTITVDWVPPTLYDRIVKKAKARRTSLRTLALRLFTTWLDTEPDDVPPTT